ncbi:Histone deacetylase HDT1 [Linum grandiflorum]
MAQMMFWGVEVKAGEPLKVSPEDDVLLHLSQAALGECKKSKGESAALYVNIDGKKLALGTLSAENIPQMQFDLVFEKEFELSHNWKGGSVFFTGYKSIIQDDEEDEFSEFDSEDEDIPMIAAENGKVEKAKPAPAKAAAAAAKPESSKPKSKAAVPVKPAAESDDDDEDESDDDEDDSDESGDDESGEEMSIEGDDSEDEDDSEEEEDTPTPKKPEAGKKRANGSAIKTPVSNKKAKTSAGTATPTPQKTDGKKGGHTDTPHPAKKEGKSAAKPQTPKSAGSVTCKSCDRKFVSDSAMQSHAKAKHSAAK